MDRKRNKKRIIAFCITLFCVITTMVGISVYIEANAEQEIEYVECQCVEKGKAPGAPVGYELVENGEGWYKQTSSGEIYLFAGWYRRLEDNTLQTVGTPKAGDIYLAKLVPEEVLTIKAQISSSLLDDTVSNDNMSAIRFVTSIDDLMYKRLGFNIKKGKLDFADADVTNYVQKNLYAMKEYGEVTEEAITKYTPSVFHPVSTYFKTWTISDIPEVAYNTDIIVIPYWITLDGTRVDGTKGLKTINLGRSWFYVDMTDTTSQELGTKSEPFTSIKEAQDYQIATIKELLTPTVILKKNYELATEEEIYRSLILTSDSGAIYSIKKNSSWQSDDEKSFLHLTSDATNVVFKNVTIDGGSDTTAQNIRGVRVDSGAKLNLNSGATIQNFNSSSSGAAVYVSGTLNVAGGILQNNTSATSGGNVYVNGSGTLNMTSGTISGGSAVTSGGNIAAIGESTASKSTISVTGGTISSGTVTGANSNDTGVGGNLYLDYCNATFEGTDTESVVTISSGISENSRGGNIYIRKYTTLNLDQNCVVQGGQAPVNGGNIMADTKSEIELNIHGATIQEGITSGDGGNIRMGKGTLTITGGQILDGQATNGGNLYIDKYEGTYPVTYSADSTTKISGGIASNYGGNIYTRSDLEIDDEQIGNGSAKYGGNVSVYSDTTLTVNGSCLDNGENTPTVTCGGHIYSAGAVILSDSLSNGVASYGGNLYLATSGTLTMNEASSIVGGTATANGGNICTQAALTLGTRTISGGSAGQYGGNVFVAKGANLTIDGTMINNGESTPTVDRGGHVYSNGTVVMKSGSSLIGGTASTGGNIALGATGILTMEAGSTISGGSAVSGGNIHALGDSTYVTTGLPSITIHGNSDSVDEVFGGVAGKSDDESAGMGGNIYAKYASVILQDGAIVSGGTAGRSGGNIHAIGCNGSNSDGTLKSAYGVKVQLDTGSKITGGSVTYAGGNESGLGGNVFMTKGTLNVNASTIEKGESVGSRGGNVYMRLQTQLTVNEDGVIQKGKAAVNGGNIFAESDSDITINYGTISGGIAGSCGGNIRMGSGTITLKGRTKTDDNGEIIIEGSIEGGIATVAGGNIDAGITSTTGNKTEIVIDGGKISDGTATVVEGDDAIAKGNGRGGNINLRNGNLTITNGTISGGVATVRGGSICVEGGETNPVNVTLTNTTISGGATTSVVPDSNHHGIGGNVYVADGTVNMINSTVENGSATNRGGNIYIRKYTTLNIDKDSSVLGGYSIMNGGNIMAEKKSVINLDGGIISGGTAGSDGGNIKITVGILNMLDGTICDGIATKNGGNILADGATVWGTKDYEGDVEGGGTEDDSTDTEGTGSEGGEGESEVEGSESTDDTENEESITTVTEETETETETETDTTQTTNANYKTPDDIKNNYGVQVIIKDGIVSGGCALTTDQNTGGMGGNIYCKAGDLSILGGTIDGTIVSENTDAEDNEIEITTNAINGGNIYAVGDKLVDGTASKEIQFVFSGGTIKAGTVSHLGGNVFVKKGTFTMNNADCSIVSGNAADNGGGLYLGEASAFVMENGCIEGNTAGSFGGNICASGIINKNTDGVESCVKPTIKITGGTINGELSSATEDTITQNAIRGGNLFMQGVDFAMSGGTIINGDAEKSGGNIHVEDKVTDGYTTTYPSTLVFTKGTISTGRIIGTSDENRGGNLYIDASTLTAGNESNEVKFVGGIANNGANICSVASTLNLNQNTYVEDGKATVSGGNIAGSRSSININGAIVQNGVAAGSDGSGGNIRVIDASTLDITSGSILKGTAKNGGNIYVSYNSAMNMSGGTVEAGIAKVTVGDTTTYGNGGNICASGDSSTKDESGNTIYAGAAITISGGTLKGDTEAITATNGGNIYMQYGTLNISNDAEISNGRVTGNGGNICAVGDDTSTAGTVITMTGGSVNGGITFDGTEDDNVYNATNGGNIYLSCGTLNMSGTALITGGRADEKAGNVYISGKTATNDSGEKVVLCGIINMTGGTISSGKTTGKAGDGESANAIGIGGNIYMNNSALNVGAADGETATISGGCSLHSRGGNIYMKNSAILNLNATGVIENGVSNANGGNVMVDSVGIINIVGGTIQNGTSETAQGGNIRLGNGGTLTINGGTITDGVSDGNGANVFIEYGAEMMLLGGKITIKNGTRTSNNTVSNVYLNKDTVTSDGTVETKLISVRGLLSTDTSIGIGTHSNIDIFAKYEGFDESVDDVATIKSWFISDDTNRPYISFDTTTKQFSLSAASQ